jgi:hypothetical protein
VSTIPKPSRRASATCWSSEPWIAGSKAARRRDRQQDRLHGNAAGVDLKQALRGVAASGEREPHARRRVDPRGQAGQHGRDDERVHDVGGARDADALERGDERRVAEPRVVPRHDADDEEHREDVEDEHTRADRVHGARDGALGLLGLARGDRDDLRTDEGEDHDHDTRQNGHGTGGEEAVVGGEVRQTGRVAAPDPEQPARGDGNERDDRRDLDRGEPELELAVGLTDQTFVSVRALIRNRLISQIGASS